MNASLFYISQLLGYRIFRWLFNFTFSRLFNFTKFWWYKVTYYTGFNPRPHAGRRLWVNGIFNWMCWFQSTPPREGRLAADGGCATVFKFQSTPPREGRHCPSSWLYSDIKFQSTPPHEGRLHYRIHRCKLTIVSIHAPTRGATGG